MVLSGPSLSPGNNIITAGISPYSYPVLSQCAAKGYWYDDGNGAETYISKVEFMGLSRDEQKKIRDMAISALF